MGEGQGHDHPNTMEAAGTLVLLVVDRVGDYMIVLRDDGHNAIGLLQIEGVGILLGNHTVLERFRQTAILIPIPHRVGVELLSSSLPLNLNFGNIFELGSETLGRLSLD